MFSVVAGDLQVLDSSGAAGVTCSEDCLHFKAFLFLLPFVIDVKIKNLKYVHMGTLRASCELAGVLLCEESLKAGTWRINIALPAVETSLSGSTLPLSLSLSP